MQAGFIHEAGLFYISLVLCWGMPLGGNCYSLFPLLNRNGEPRVAEYYADKTLVAHPQLKKGSISRNTDPLINEADLLLFIHEKRGLSQVP
ncbi:MAG TPA: hypothetical protein DIW64_04750 [Cellvibrio sp.]|nr:hypothetical protein [Cellvibrio sp.]